MAPSARDPIAVVAPAVDISQLDARWAQLDAREERALSEIRLDRGRVLIDARRAFPTSGPKAAGWGELLGRWKIEERTAQRYMQLAGYVAAQAAEVPDKVSGIPTYAQAGIGRPPAPRVVLAPRAANLPTPAASAPPAPRAAPERKEQPRFVPDSQEEAAPPEPVIVLDEGAVRAPPSRIAQAPAAPPRQLSFGWAEAAAVAKKECRGIGAAAVAELVADLCERTPGLRELLRRQLAAAS